MLATLQKSAINLLIIDDSKGDAMIFRKSLMQAAPLDYTITHEEKLSAGIARIKEAMPDIVMLDLNLPDVEGIDGLRQILSVAPELPVVMLTGSSDEAIALQTLERGAQDYLQKDQMDGRIIHRAIKFALQRCHNRELLMRQANYDPLTGLANRFLFESRVEFAIARAKRSGTLFSLLYLDLDKFKPVNDRFGHHVGDGVLQEVSFRLKNCVRTTDTAARLGGDEFAMLIDPITNAQDAAIVAEKILHAIQQPMQLHGIDIAIGVSIGIAAPTADDPQTVVTLLKQADHAMYVAKMRGQSGYHFYVNDPSLMVIG